MTRDEAVRYAFAELHQTFFDELHALMAKVDARARAEEREACAVAAKEFLQDGSGHGEFLGNLLAQHIRERGEKA